MKTSLNIEEKAYLLGLSVTDLLQSEWFIKQCAGWKKRELLKLVKAIADHVKIAGPVKKKKGPNQKAEAAFQ